MFYDEARIQVISGDGGDGMIGFRREKFVSMGGPNGGDGGAGGGIIFVANEKVNSLFAFHRRVHIRAGHGAHGGTSNKTGAAGKTLRLEAPLGTIIRDEESKNILAELLTPGQEALLVAGGRGGRGNARFKSSRNQAPRVAERGEPGSSLWLNLELKLIADVGIAGMPNAGKSTLLSVISAARPKIASYPFTTLKPNLGVVELDDYKTMVMADIPGLIEGAAEGIGLGHAFLRHIERTRVLIHLLDGSSKNPIEDWEVINQELALYSEALSQKPQLVVLNKIDLPDSIAWEPLVAEHIVEKGLPFMSISAVTKENVRQMLFRVYEMVAALPPPLPVTENEVIISSEINEDLFEIEREGNGWRLMGKRIERVAAMTYWEFEATVMRFQKILEELGISKALEDAGIQPGDIVHIGAEELEWGESFELE